MGLHAKDDTDRIEWLQSAVEELDVRRSDSPVAGGAHGPRQATLISSLVMDHSVIQCDRALGYAARHTTSNGMIQSRHVAIATRLNNRR